MLLTGKHILVGISGGIAAYKIPSLIRLFRKVDAEVRVVTTTNALQFVTPVTLTTLSGNRVCTDLFADRNEASTEHISLTDWADVMLIAPATADVLSKMAYGICDDVLTTTFCAMRKPVIIAPAMNEKMLDNPAIARALEQLTLFPNVTVLPCAEGVLACGTSGRGRMIEIDSLFYVIQRSLCPHPLQDKHILVTAGPTQEDIDSVRYLSNRSSGKMGYALATACETLGATVTLVSGPSHCTLDPLSTIERITIRSAQEMYEAVVKHHQEQDVFILCAAVADYTPTHTSPQKIKKSDEEYTLSLTPTPDIAKWLGVHKTSNQTLIGFALESEEGELNALSKLHDKQLDYIVLNSLQTSACFESDDDLVTIYSVDDKKYELPLLPKELLAYKILEHTICCYDSIIPINTKI